MAEEKRYIPPKGSKVDKASYFNLIEGYNIRNYAVKHSESSHDDEYKIVSVLNKHSCGKFHIRATYVDCYVPEEIELIKESGSFYEHYKSSDPSTSKNYKIIVNSPHELLNAIAQLIRIHEPDFILKKLVKPISFVIDIKQNKDFQYIHEIINTYMGYNYSGYMKGYFPIPHKEDEIGLWFPKMSVEKNGVLKPQPNSGGWMNVFYDNGRGLCMYYEDNRDIDMTIVKKGMHLAFVKDGITGRYKYAGNFVQDDEKCTSNKVCFKRVGTKFDFAAYYSVSSIKIPETEEEQEEHAQELPIELLRKIAAKRGTKQPVVKITPTKQIVRDKYIAEYAKKSADGICQLCSNPAPFISKSGKPYLESHHIIPLADSGEDTIENTTALCPNCHRKMHNLADAEDVKKLQNKNKKIMNNIL